MPPPPLRATVVPLSTIVCRCRHAGQHGGSRVAGAVNRWCVPFRAGLYGLHTSPSTPR